VYKSWGSGARGFGSCAALFSSCFRPMPNANSTTKRPRAKQVAKAKSRPARPAAKHSAAKNAAARPSGKQPTGAAKQSVGPTNPVTRRQLDTIRSVFADLDFDDQEHFDARSDTSFFHIDTGVGELEDVRVVHRPGLLSVHARFGVAPKEAHRRELEHFAARLNACLLHGCVVVSDEPRLRYRTSLNDARVADLEKGYVAGLIADVLGMIEAVDLPLILIAKGESADAAIEKVLEVEEAMILPPATAKKVAERRT